MGQVGESWRMLFQPHRHGAADQSRRLQFAQLMYNLDRSCAPFCAVPRKGEPECAHQPLKRQIDGATWHCVITYVNQPSGLEMVVDEAAQGILTVRIHPRVDAVGHDVIESPEIGFRRSGEVRSMKLDILNSTFCRKTPSVFDMRRYEINTAKASSRMCRSQNCRGQTLSTAEITPGKFPLP